MRNRVWMITIALAGAAVLSSGAAPAQSASSGQDSDPWSAFRPLVGVWKGEGAGFGGPSDVTHRWSFVLDDQFLELRTRSAARRDDGPGEVHEDVGYLSRDKDRGTFVFRQFLSEGFVNTYDVSVETDGGARLLFGYREAESAGGMRARMRLTFSGEDRYEMVLDLAAPGKEFAACQTMQMTKTP